MVSTVSFPQSTDIHTFMEVGELAIYFFGTLGLKESVKWVESVQRLSYNLQPPVQSLQGGEFYLFAHIPCANKDIFYVTPEHMQTRYMFRCYIITL